MKDAQTSTPGDSASDFLDAIRWGRHTRVWELLSPTGRGSVLDRAVRRGLDPSLAERIRIGIAPSHESDRFLSELVRGLRRDLSGADLDLLRLSAVVHPLGPDRVTIDMEVPLVLPMPDVPGERAITVWPAGRLDLSRCDEAWRIDRLVPRTRVRSPRVAK